MLPLAWHIMVGKKRWLAQSQFNDLFALCLAPTW
jgi:chromate transport protein ChrA